MDTKHFFFVNVRRCLVSAVYFVIVPIGYTLLALCMNFKLCSIHISACNCNALCRKMDLDGSYGVQND